MMLGIAVSPIWVIMLSVLKKINVANKWAMFIFMVVRPIGRYGFMNLLIKVHPTRFAFMMSLVVLIAWILYYFVDVKLTNYNTRQLKLN